jgi:hypothetical protein
VGAQAPGDHIRRLCGRLFINDFKRLIKNWLRRKRQQVLGLPATKARLQKRRPPKVPLGRTAPRPAGNIMGNDYRLVAASIGRQI